MIISSRYGFVDNNYDSLIFNLNGAGLIKALQIRFTHQQEEAPDSG